MALTCVIIDDEPLARECIANYVAEVDFLKLVGMGNNPLDLAQLLEKHSPDLVFLDIQLQRETGFDLLTRFNPVDFEVIFTTAYDQYALQAFKTHSVDYLLKPIKLTELQAALQKLRQWHRR